MNARRRWLLLPALGVALLLNLVLLTGAALLAGDKPVTPPPYDPVPVNLVNLDRPRPPEPRALPTPPPEPTPEPVKDFTPELARPRLMHPDLGALSVKLDPAPWRDQPPMGGYVFGRHDLDEPPRALVRTAPVYPFKARQRNIDGYVEVKLLVKADGTVGSVEILKADPPGVFDAAALEAVPRWIFSPGKIEGRNVASWVITRVLFTLD